MGKFLLVAVSIALFVYAAYDLLATPADRQITGTILTVDGGALT